MSDMEDLLRDILDELKDLNSKVDKLTSYNMYNLDDVCKTIKDAASSITGSGFYGSISDVYDKVEDISDKLD